MGEREKKVHARQMIHFNQCQREVWGSGHILASTFSTREENKKRNQDGWGRIEKTTKRIK
jgi:hypothetical protein